MLSEILDLRISFSSFKGSIRHGVSARSSKAPHLHQEALVVLPQVAVGLQQALQMLPQPRSLLRVLGTQPGDQQHSSCVNRTTAFKTAHHQEGTCKMSHSLLRR